MPQSIIGAWRAFSMLKQADIATVQAVDTRLAFEGDPMEPEPERLCTNDDEITGELLPTKARLLTKKFAGKHKSKAFPHVVGMFASMAMGKDTSTMVASTTAYRHKLEIDKTIVELPTRTMIENDGATQKVYRGIACSGFTISGQRGDFVEFEADLIGSGAEADDATAKPEVVNESYLVYGDVNLYRGGTFDGSTVTGGTSLSGSLRSFKVGFKNSGKGVYLFGDASGNVGSIRRGQKYEVELEADIELEDSTHRAALLAGTEYVMHIPIIGGTANGTAKYTIEIIMPRVIYKEAKKGHDEGTLKIAAKYGVMSHATYGGLIINVVNMHQASYLAAA